MTLVQNPAAPEKPSSAGTSTAETWLLKNSPAEKQDAVSLRTSGPAQTFGTRDHSASSRRDFNAAIELIEKASEAIDVLQARCRQLQTEIKEVRERSRLEVEAAESIAAEWQTLARATKAQLDDCENRLALTKQAADAAEARAEQTKERLESVQHLASEEAEQSARFHDKIVSAFGVGSRVHTALDELDL